MNKKFEFLSTIWIPLKVYDSVRIKHKLWFKRARSQYTNDPFRRIVYNLNKNYFSIKNEVGTYIVYKTTQNFQSLTACLLYALSVVPIVQWFLEQDRNKQYSVGRKHLFKIRERTKKLEIPTLQNTIEYYTLQKSTAHR